MKALKKDLQSMVKSLKALTQKTEKIAKQLDKLKKATVAKKPRARVRVKAKPVKKAAARKIAVRKKPVKKAAASKTAIKKPKKISASDTVLNIIKKSKKGVYTATLKKKTGFKDNNIRMIVYRLKKQGRIRSGGKGIYLKA